MSGIIHFIRFFSFLSSYSKPLQEESDPINYLQASGIPLRALLDVVVKAIKLFFVIALRKLKDLHCLLSLSLYFTVKRRRRCS